MVNVINCKITGSVRLHLRPIDNLSIY